MAPMLLFEITTVPELIEPSPYVVPPLPEVLVEMDSVPLALPMVLPVSVPMFTEPACT